MRFILILLIILTVTVPVSADDFTVKGTKGTRLAAGPVAAFNEPWAMTFLPKGTLTEKRGTLWHVNGDGLNLIVPGKNYGWPIVSNGDHYSGIPIPDHDTRPEFEAPRTYWCLPLHRRVL